jgi:hypothetical protein
LRFEARDFSDLWLRITGMTGRCRLVIATLGACSCAVTFSALGASARSTSPVGSAATRWICPARFSKLPPSWVQGNLGTRPSTTTSDAWAHTHGFTNLSDIIPAGIYIQVLLATHRTSPARSALRPLRLPLDIQRPDQIGNDDGPLSEYRFAGRYHGLYVDVRVDYGRRHPLLKQRKRAQPILARLLLPRGLVRMASACR